MRTILSIFLFSFIMTASASWYVEHTGEGNKRIKINDSKYTFNMDDVACTVSETDFTRTGESSNYYIIESRQITCNLGHNIQVNTTANCDYPNAELTHFNVFKEKAGYSVMLICGPDN